MLSLRKSVSLVCVAALMLLSLGGCAAGSENTTDSQPQDQAGQAQSESTAPAPTGGEEELQFWTWRVEDIAFYDGVIQEFEAQNPGIKVVQNAVKAAEYPTTLSAAFASNSGPDVLMTRAYGGLQVYTDSGYILALDDLLPELQDFDDTTLLGARSTTDGKLYGVPAMSQTMLCFYNTKIYDELGLSVPKTWAQFLANMDACQAAGYLGTANGSKEGLSCEFILGSMGPTFYGADFYDRVTQGETTFEDPVFVKAVDKINELKPYMAEQFQGVSRADEQVSFANGLSAHLLGGSFEASVFLDLNPDITFDVFAIPGETEADKAYVSMFLDGNYSANASTKYQESALKFLRHVMTPEFGRKLVNDLQMASSIPGVNVSENPYIAKVLSLHENSAPYLFYAGFRYEQPTGSTLFQAACQGMLAEDLTAEEVCAQVQEGVATYYKPFQK